MSKTNASGRTVGETTYTVNRTTENTWVARAYVERSGRLSRDTYVIGEASTEIDAKLMGAKEVAFWA